MSQALKIHHDLCDVVLKPSGKINQTRLKKMIRSALDQYLAEDRVSAKAIHDEAKQRHGDAYRMPGYYLRLYRQRAGLTQAELAEQAGIRQHHLSEMENNKRVLGKANAKKLSNILDCDYRKLL
ncbi:MAG: helix-turn-helix transcriptional regulator [Gammaproteobacteria bacterium]|nr:helix-turn-helix transcriptional regulator [Gammaproteobacteria bacterium]